MSDPDYTIPISSSPESTSGSKIEYGYKILNSDEIVGGQYRILQELGSGGFSTTYVAVDNGLADTTQFVVKQLQPRFNSPAIWENAKDRFATEATVLQWLGNHSQIPQLLAHFEENKQFYLVQEFIEGEEFEQEVNRQVLNEEELIDFLCDVLEILEFVHNQGVIHRDIKPSNLIRRKLDHKIVLIDFGAVKEIGTFVLDSAQDRTQVIGTPGYMSPEQNHGRPVYSSDIYALGKTAIFALTGRSPIEWEYASADNSTNTWDSATSVSPQLTAVINKMTNPQSLERYSSAKEVMQDLKPLLRIGITIQDEYQILRYLGGETGICNYVAKNLKHEQEPLYILKILTPTENQASIVDIAEGSLKIAINNLAKLNKLDSVPQILECFFDRESLYLVQAYVEGEDLQQIIQRELFLTEEEVIAFLQETAKTLVSIHKQKIIHQNIQPSSLIRYQGGEKIALVNFGAIAEAVNITPDSKIGYFPPEQIAQRPVAASDIYALGITAIYALTGIEPKNLEQNNRTGEVIWQNKARVSPELKAIVDRMVKLDLQQRYQSAAQVLKALKKIRKPSKFKSWYKYIIIAALGGLGFIGSIFGRYLWQQYEAIVLFTQADAQLDSRQYEKAIRYYDQGFQKVGERSKNFPEAWLRKATALSHLKRYDEMLATCDQGLQVNQSFYFWNCKGLALEGLKQYDQSIEAYEQAIQLQPEFFEAWNNRGEAYVHLNQPVQAKANFEKAIQLNPEKSYVPWNNLGKLHFEQGEYELAIRAYQQATQVKEDYLPSLIGLGNAHKSQKMYYDAIDSYERAIEVNRNSHEAWFGKGLAQESLQQYREAIKCYEKAISLKPNWNAAIQALRRVESRK